MPRIKILDRADMNAEQGRVYDAAKQGSGIVGGPYYAYIRLPKLFAAAQNMRDSMAGGPLSPREQQIVNMTVARHWGARYPGSRRPGVRCLSAFRRRSSTQSMRGRRRT